MIRIYKDYLSSYFITNWRLQMIKNKLKFLSFILYLSMISTNFLSAADCVDNTTGGWMAFTTGPSAGCGTVLAAPGDGGFGIACSGGFAGLNASAECPVTCSTCPGVCGDGIYSWDEVLMTWICLS